MNSREIYKQIILIENELNNLFIEAQIGERKHKRRPDLLEPEKIEDMLKRLRDGESLISIAKIYHTDNQTIRKILGGKMPKEELDELVQQNRKSRPDLREPKKIEDMLKRLRDGESLSSIADVYDANNKTIRNILGGKMSEKELDELVQQNKNESRPDLREPEKIEDMLKRLRDGESLISIADVYDTSDNTIRRILGGKMSEKELDDLVQQNRKESRPDLWKKEKIEDMLKRFRDGESISSIAKVYDTSYITIRNILLDRSGGDMSKKEFDELVQQNRNELRPDLREPEKIEDMLKRLRDGESLCSIADVYDTSDKTIKRILLYPYNGNKPPMSREEYNEIIARRRSMGSRIRRRPKGSRITPENPNADPVNTYSSRATGDDPVLSGPTRDPIVEAVDLVVEGIRRKDLHSKKDKIIKFFKSGLSLGEIAKKFKTSHVQIKYLLGIWMSDKEYRNTISIRKNNIRKDLLDKKEEIIDLSKQGLTTRQIAAKFNTGSSQISRLLKKWKEDGSDKNQEEIKKPTAEKPPRKLRKNPTIAQPIDPKQKKQPTPATDKFKIGDKVYHATFGAGLITNIEGAGSNQRFTIDFETVGQKVLIPTYARLSKNPITEDPIAEAVELIIETRLRPDLWETEKIADMLKRFRDGKSIKSIARFYDANKHTIKSILLDPRGGNMSPEEFKKLKQQIKRPDLWEKEKIADMLKKFRDGKSLHSIAKAYHTKPDTIKSILLDPRGGNMSPEEFKKLKQQNTRPDLWKKEKIADMLKRFRDGKSIKSIARFYDANSHTIKKILLSRRGGNMPPEEFNELAQHKKFRPDLWETEKIADILKGFRGGESPASMGRFYHCDGAAIRYILLRNMPREEYNEIIARRSMGSRIRRNLKGSRITPEDPNADPVNTYSSRATGDDPVLSGPTRDPITEAVEEVIKLHFST